MLKTCYFRDTTSTLFKILFSAAYTRYDDVVMVVTRPLPRDDGSAEDFGAPEVEQLLRAWTRGRTVTESHQRQFLPDLPKILK